MEHLWLSKSQSGFLKPKHFYPAWGDSSMDFTPTAKLRSLSGLRHCSSPSHKHGSRELMVSERNNVPTSNDAFWVSGRASFLNLRTITSELVLKEKFKQNKMGMMAGKHSEILSEETECWPEALVQSLNDCKTHQTSPDWQHIQRPWQLSSNGAHLGYCLLSREGGSEEQQPAGLFPQGLTKSVSWTPPPGAFPHGDQHRECFPSISSMPSGWGKALLFIRRNSGSRGCVFACVLPSYFSAPSSVCTPVSSTSQGALRNLCPPSSSSGDRAETAGPPPRVSYLAQRFPAEVICPRISLAATQCHLCRQPNPATAGKFGHSVGWTCRCNIIQ